MNDEGHPDFSALQAALSDGDTDDLVFFAFDLLFADGEDLAPAAAVERKERLRTLLNKHARSKTSPLRYVEHFDADGEPCDGHPRARPGWKASSRSRPMRAYRSGRSGTWLKIKSRPGHEVVIGAWTSNNGKFSSLMVGVNERLISPTPATSAPATAPRPSNASCRR